MDVHASAKHGPTLNKLLRRRRGRGAVTVKCVLAGDGCRRGRNGVGLHCHRLMLFIALVGGYERGWRLSEDFGKFTAVQFVEIYYRFNKQLGIECCRLRRFHSLHRCAGRRSLIFLNKKKNKSINRAFEECLDNGDLRRCHKTWESFLMSLSSSRWWFQICNCSCSHALRSRIYLNLR